MLFVLFLFWNKNETVVHVCDNYVVIQFCVFWVWGTVKIEENKLQMFEVVLREKKSIERKSENKISTPLLMGDFENIKSQDKRVWNDATINHDKE